ncbi:hypothetical protein Metfor_1378 [Methanoregula formicica SMSP]|uniref:Transposase n=1 Tax=Methanoregula formicica (strain DSM 22288 / NBRC 105244 / SMSP) TaxID=593750 RepID=L0HCE8_METFS|nr:hypothetical protein Metfor_1378 [Methanoregula formicica SMSP]
MTPTSPWTKRPWLAAPDGILFHQQSNGYASREGRNFPLKFPAYGKISGHSGTICADQFHLFRRGKRAIVRNFLRMCVVVITVSRLVYRGITRHFTRFIKTVVGQLRYNPRHYVGSILRYSELLSALKGGRFDWNRSIRSIGSTTNEPNHIAPFEKYRSIFMEKSGGST